jgi:hypothetical protein
VLVGETFCLFCLILTLNLMAEDDWGDDLAIDNDDWGDIVIPESTPIFEVNHKGQEDGVRLLTMKLPGNSYVDPVLEKISTIIKRVYIEECEFDLTFTIQFASALARSSSIEFLRISRCSGFSLEVWKAFAQGISHYKSLRYLQLVSNSESPEGAVNEILSALSKNSSVTSLALVDMNFKGIYFWDMLKSNNTLLQLFIASSRHEELSFSSMNTEKNFQNTSLEVLCFFGVAVDYYALESLRFQLFYLTTVKSLRFINHFAFERRRPFEEIMGKLIVNGIQKLCLDCSKLSKYDLEEIGRSVTRSNTLQSLSLAALNLPADVWTDFCVQLEHQSSLTDLNLSENQIGDASVDSLARILASQSNLTCLQVGNCKIGKLGFSKLAEALSSNDTLISLNYCFNVAVDSATFGQLLTRNSSLQRLEIDQLDYMAFQTAFLSNQTLREFICPSRNEEDDYDDNLWKHVSENHTRYCKEVTNVFLLWISRNQGNSALFEKEVIQTILKMMTFNVHLVSHWYNVTEYRMVSYGSFSHWLPTL